MNLYTLLVLSLSSTVYSTHLDRSICAFWVVENFLLLYSTTAVCALSFLAKIKQNKNKTKQLFVVVVVVVPLRRTDSSSDIFIWKVGDSFCSHSNGSDRT